MILEFKFGDRVWFHNQCRLDHGNVLKIVSLPGYSYPFYVVRQPNGTAPIISIHSGLDLTDDPEFPIGKYRK